MIYSLLLLVGVLGYAALVILGFAHTGHHGANHSLSHGHGALGHGAGHGAIGHGAGAHGATGHGPVGHAAGPQGGNNQATAGHGSLITHSHSVQGTHGQGQDAAPGRDWSWFLSLSPLDFFSLAMGAGLTGYLLTSLLGKGSALIGLIPWFAGLGGLVFTLAFVKPFTRFLLQFASSPSKGLEGSVDNFALAETSFDAEGRGLVTVTVDGQISRMLATLEGPTPEHRIRKGDRLLVMDVDPTKGTCRVSTEILEQIK